MHVVAGHTVLVVDTNILLSSRGELWADQKRAMDGHNFPCQSSWSSTTSLATCRSYATSSSSPSRRTSDPTRHRSRSGRPAATTSTASPCTRTTPTSWATRRRVRITDALVGYAQHPLRARYVAVSMLATSPFPPRPLLLDDFYARPRTVSSAAQSSSRKCTRQSRPPASARGLCSARSPHAAAADTIVQRAGRAEIIPTTRVPVSPLCGSASRTVRVSSASRFPVAAFPSRRV